MTKVPFKLAFILACISCLALGVLVFLPGLPGAFVFDDYSSIVENSALNVPDLAPATLLRAMFSAPTGGLLRPLSMLTFIVDVHFWGLSTFAFKLTNILFHLASGVVLGCMAREILRAYARRWRPDWTEQTLSWLSLTATALWLLHPLNLTAVLYVVQREAALAALFSAAAIWAYLVGRRRQLEKHGGGLAMWVATPALIAMGMLSKENAALTPLLLLVVEGILLDFRDADGRPSHSVRWFFVLFLAVPLLAAGALFALRPAYFLAGYVIRDFNMYERVLTECRILLDYLRWTFIPDLRQLALYHDDIAPSRGLLQPWTTLPAVLTIFALLAAAWGLRRRVPLVSLGILWYFAGHLMESTILPLELAFEHRNYLPIYGVVLGVTGSLYAAVRDVGQRRLAVALAAAIGLLFAASTAVRAADWGTELDFARSEAAHHPQSPRAQYELAWAYLFYVVATKDTSVVPLAVQAAERSKAADKGSINQDIGLSYMFAQLHDIPRAQLYLEAAATDANAAVPSATLQLALLTFTYMTAPEDKPLFAAMDRVMTNAAANPRLTRYDCYAAEIWNTLALFRQKIDEIPAALSAMHRAVTLCPMQPQMRVNFARMLLYYGDPRDAEEQILALRRLGDVRFLPDLLQLEQQRDQELNRQNKN